jgi:peroxiredoxin
MDLSSIDSKNNFSSNKTVSAANKNLIGTKALDWEVSDWLNSPPVKLKDLSGKVVLVRWWTAGCPFCVATAPALQEFYQEFKPHGLEVIGFYHHKSDEPLKKEEVYSYAKNLGFNFPIAIDYHWQTLKAWWLNTGDRDWTSVSFLIDRKGIIRHIHPGGKYVKGDADYQLMRKKINELLAE